MFDPRVVVVPSAGRPTAVPLWVPALREGGLSQGRGDWWVVAVTQRSDWPPACHLTWVCSVRDSGMFDTCGRTCRSRDELQTVNATGAQAHRHARELALPLTHSHLITFSELQVLHKGKLFSHCQISANLCHLYGKGNTAGSITRASTETESTFSKLFLQSVHLGQTFNLTSKTHSQHQNSWYIKQTCLTK